MATKPVLSRRTATKTKLAVEGCESERAFRGLHGTIHSKFWIFGYFRIEPVQEFHQESGCVCGPAKWMRQIFDISTFSESLFCICMIVDSPKAAIVVVICPWNALINSHILELKGNPKTVNTTNIVFRIRS